MSRAEIETLSREIINPIGPWLINYKVCGSYRRGKPDSGDIDIVYLPYEDKTGVVDIELEHLYGCKATHVKKSFMYNGVQVEMLPANFKDWGAMILYATGPGEFNVEMRRKAKSLGYKLNQYGLFEFKNGEYAYVVGRSEEEIFIMLQMPWLLPEERK